MDENDNIFRFAPDFVTLAFDGEQRKLVSGTTVWKHITAGRLIPDNYTKKQNAFIRIELERQKIYYPELNGAYILMEYAYNTQYKNAVKHEGWECRPESVKKYIEDWSIIIVNKNHYTN